jgi:hypothetical protein
LTSLTTSALSRRRSAWVWLQAHCCGTGLLCVTDQGCIAFTSSRWNPVGDTRSPSIYLRSSTTTRITDSNSHRLAMRKCCLCLHNSRYHQDHDDALSPVRQELQMLGGTAVSSTFRQIVSASNNGSMRIMGSYSRFGPCCLMSCSRLSGQEQLSTSLTHQPHLEEYSARIFLPQTSS